MIQVLMIYLVEFVLSYMFWLFTFL